MNLCFRGICRSRRVRWKQVPDVAGSSRGGNRELRRQHGREEPLHHLREGDQGPPQSAAVRLRWRYGDGHSQEGEAGSQEEGHACRHRPPAQALAPKGWCLHVL